MRIKRYLKEEMGSFIIQEWLFKWYQSDKTVYKTIKDAKRAAESKLKGIERTNKRAKKNEWKPKAHGTIEIRPLRVVDITTGETFPATKRDEQSFKKNKTYYMEVYIG